MDRVTKANIRAFRDEQSFPAGYDESKLFEHFANYCVITEAYGEEFDIHDVHSGGGNDLTIDGLAVIVNGVLVLAIEEAKDLLDTNKHLEVDFIFVQAKSGSNFSGEEMVAFKDGVKDFFSEELKLPVSEKISERRKLMSWIYENGDRFKQRNPNCEMHFVTTGSWQDDHQLMVRIERILAEVKETSLFNEVRFVPVGAKGIQESWRRSKDSVEAEFNFAKKTTLPDIDGVEESYLGVLPVSEFLKVISDDESGIKKHIFVDNVRDYQGDNSVNVEMSESLQTPEGRARFAVLNNGVTLVARGLKNVADKFTASDYQIVNGCQTSHVVYNNKDILGDDMPIPFKVIATNNEDVISAIATATNRQTQVTVEDLFALTEFQKDLENFLGSFEGKQKLHYERRSRQYAQLTGIEKVRIITKQIEIRAFAAVFLNDAHRAARYYNELKADVGKSMFRTDHKLDPYYAAAYAYYRLEYLFRNGLIPVSYKPARYHLLMTYKNLVCAPDMPAFTANKIVSYSRTLTDSLWDESKSLAGFERACRVVDEALGETPLTNDAVKTRQFTERVLAASKA
ncbi:hypothetical protein HDC34_003220 [Pseudoclavibacter sp. JAI123]|uniref:AIPR family protein n=1 Tax=Pseudoclavibacter sp. JAI123 TaxID=2723065 RepID=UPI0015CAA55C|nr:AIPR family protein [Pseudoclavibacter sp. JAI123]NYF14885.1 hypothetical protein [Pseudoclavibacter sp. JAI123]